jgi:uncharacterized protein
MTATESQPIGAAAIHRPLPEVDEASRFFWDGLNQHKLLILKCQSCGKFNHWPRPICRFCLSDDQVPAEVSGQGTVWSYTVVTYPFHPGLVPPYVLASIELVEQPGLRLVSNIVDCPEDDLAVGMAVEVFYEVVTADITVPLFRVVR